MKMNPVIAFAALFALSLLHAAEPVDRPRFEKEILEPVARDTIQITDLIAEGLEHTLDHQAGTIEAFDLRDLSIPATTKAVHQGGEAKITKTQQPLSK